MLRILPQFKFDKRTEQALEAFLNLDVVTIRERTMTEDSDFRILVECHRWSHRCQFFPIEARIDSYEFLKVNVLTGLAGRPLRCVEDLEDIPQYIEGVKIFDRIYDVPDILRNQENLKGGK